MAAPVWRAAKVVVEEALSYRQSGLWRERSTQEVEIMPFTVPLLRSLEHLSHLFSVCESTEETPNEETGNAVVYIKHSLRIAEVKDFLPRQTGNVRTISLDEKLWSFYEVLHITGLELSICMIIYRII